MIQALFERTLDRLKSRSRYRLLKRSRWGVDWVDDCLRMAREAWIPGISAPYTVFDVGANRGQTASMMLKRMPIAKLCCFEPVPSTFEKLHANLATKPAVECFPFGLSDFEGQSKIRIFSSSLLASTCDSSPILSADSRLFDHTESIQLRTLDSFCEEFEITCIDLLKVDTEGADLRTLRGAESMLRDHRVSMVLFEFYCASSGETADGTLKPIDAYLNSYGYRLVSFYTDFVHPEQPVGVYNALYVVGPQGSQPQLERGAAA